MENIDNLELSESLAEENVLEDVNAFRKFFNFALNKVVESRAKVLKFGSFAIPLIIAYNAGKVILAMELGGPIMEYLQVDEETQKTFINSSVPIVLGTSKTLYVGIWLTAEKLRDVFKKYGGISSVFHEFARDERS